MDDSAHAVKSAAEGRSAAAIATPGLRARTGRARGGALLGLPDAASARRRTRHRRVARDGRGGKPLFRLRGDPLAGRRRPGARADRLLPALSRGVAAGPRPGRPVASCRGTLGAGPRARPGGRGHCRDHVAPLDRARLAERSREPLRGLARHAGAGGPVRRRRRRRRRHPGGAAARVHPPALRATSGRRLARARDLLHRVWVGPPDPRLGRRHT